MWNKGGSDLTKTSFHSSPFFLHGILSATSFSSWVTFSPGLPGLQWKSISISFVLPCSSTTDNFAAPCQESHILQKHRHCCTWKDPLILQFNITGLQFIARQTFLHKLTQWLTSFSWQPLYSWSLLSFQQREVSCNMWQVYCINPVKDCSRKY